MLVLSRKVNEGIILIVPPSPVAQVVEVKTVQLKGNVVRVGVDADITVLIRRSELPPSTEELQLREHGKNPQSATPESNPVPVQGTVPNAGTGS